MEEMSAFFTRRVDGYDEHMLRTVTGCREGYTRLAALVPQDAHTLLDLGCGTGLELDAILPGHPTLQITGIDLTQAMLDVLRGKHPDARLNLICGSYFEVPLGENAFDCAVSFQTLHHFSHEVKQALYQKIHRALKPGGLYLECDYMVLEQAEEDFYFSENRRLRAQEGLTEDAFFHFDTPCTEENQIRLLKAAGFVNVEKLWREGNTTLLWAKK